VHFEIQLLLDASAFMHSVAIFDMEDITQCKEPTQWSTECNILCWNSPASES